MIFNVGALVTSAGALTHLMYDLYSTSDIDSFVEELRAEMLQALEEEGEWNMRALNKLPKLDSAIKESLRISVFSTRVCGRKVSTIRLQKLFQDLLVGSKPDIFLFAGRGSKRCNSQGWDISSFRSHSQYPALGCASRSIRL